MSRAADPKAESLDNFLATWRLKVEKTNLWQWDVSAKREARESKTGWALDNLESLFELLISIFTTDDGNPIKTSSSVGIWLLKR